MQREPGKRDYGSSDCAALRALASRGVSVPQPVKPAARESRPERRHSEQRPDPGASQRPDTRAPA
jgi:hypothetical protein